MTEKFDFIETMNDLDAGIFVSRLTKAIKEVALGVITHDKKGKVTVTILCPYCIKKAELASSSEIYGGRDYGPIWICRECDAYVGCHQGTENPLGTLANKETRNARVAAHARFDLLWEGKMKRDGCSKGQARRAAYKWLAEQMGMDPKQCHISMFQPNQCIQVAALCTPPFINTI